MPVGDCGQALKLELVVLAKLARENASVTGPLEVSCASSTCTSDSISALEQPYLPAGDGERAERQQGRQFEQFALANRPDEPAF
jgi:hypothetical protein